MIKVSRIAPDESSENKNLQNGIIKSSYYKILHYICKLYILYVSYFCLDDVRLKHITLRLNFVETILEWKLALVYDRQLARNNNVGGAFVKLM